MVDCRVHRRISRTDVRITSVHLPLTSPIVKVAILFYSLHYCLSMLPNASSTSAISSKSPPRARFVLPFSCTCFCFTLTLWCFGRSKNLFLAATFFLVATCLFGRTILLCVKFDRGRIDNGVYRCLIHTLFNRICTNCKDHLTILERRSLKPRLLALQHRHRLLVLCLDILIEFIWLLRAETLIVPASQLFSTG